MRQLYFEDVATGDAGPPLSHQLTRTDLVMYAGASGDFNPMHTDEVKAKEAGLPSVFGHGMFSAGLLGTALTNFVGVGNLRSYKVRFTKQTWPGEMLTTKVVVAEKRPERSEVVLTCELVNQDGEAKIAGEAVAALPTRSGRNERDQRGDADRGERVRDHGNGSGRNERDQRGDDDRGERVRDQGNPS